MLIFPITVPKFNSKFNVWDSVEYKSQEDFIIFLQRQIKLPGTYNLKNTKKNWCEQANNFIRDGYYTKYVRGTPSYSEFWKKEKDKVKNGVIIDNVYIPPFFYQYLNYNRIKNKRTKKYEFPNVWDGDLFFMQNVLLASLIGKHIVLTKTRQRGYSYKIAAIQYWLYCWQEKSISTIGASDERYVKKTWIFLDGYREHMNAHTAFTRGPQQAKKLEWEEFKYTSDMKKVGNMSIIKGVTFKVSASNDVGGAQDLFFYEEAGIAPKLIETLGYLRNAMEDGDMTTGTIIVSGSVGDLDDCKDLQHLMRNPSSENFMEFDNVYDDEQFPMKMGLFVPDFWNLGGFTDEDGNSLVEEAKEFIAKRDAEALKNKSTEQYKLYKSQNPSKPSEAFSIRKDSRFPTTRIEKQQGRIKDGIVNKGINVKLFEKEDGKIGWELINKEPMGYPVDPKCEDKSGVVTIYEKPCDNPGIGVYFGGFDTIEANTTDSSESLFAGYIVKAAKKEFYTDPEDFKNKIRLHNIQLVATYVGRIEETLDGTKKTNTIGEHLIRLYNAKSLIERNKPNFINHLRDRGLSHLMFKEYEVPFFKDAILDKDTHKDFGIHMDSTGRKQDHLIDVILEYFSEELDVKNLTKEDGTITDIVLKTTFGIERIPDYWFLEECKLWYKGRNADRMVAFGLGLVTAKTMQTSGYVQTEYNIDKSKIKKETIKYVPQSLFGNRSNISMLNSRRSQSLLGRR